MRLKLKMVDEPDKKRPNLFKRETELLRFGQRPELPYGV